MAQGRLLGNLAWFSSFRSGVYPVFTQPTRRNGNEKPMLLKPLATAEFLVAQKEIKGGSGANFIVEWISDAMVNKPVIEAVMIGIEGQTSISFVRTGIAIEKQKG
jgi:hypothetical protein